MRRDGQQNKDHNPVIASHSEAIPTMNGIATSRFVLLAMTHIGMRTLFSLVIIGGLWLFSSPFVLDYLGVARGNALLLGLVLTIIGIMGLAGVSGKHPGNS